MDRESKLLQEFFACEKIEYYASATIDSLPVIRQRLMPPNAKTAIVFLIPYYVECTNAERNISSYAVSKDYHLYAKELSARLERLFEAVGSNHFVKIMCDHSPIDEKGCAERLGLGVIGQNRLLINSEYGSYVFIGEVYTDAIVDIKSVDRTPVSPEFCKSCNACARACPTLLSGRGECMSALTQKKNPTDEEQRLLDSAVMKWGCDVCAGVCPHNKGLAETPIPFFLQNRIEVLTSSDIESMTDEEFLQRAFSWRGRAFAVNRFKR